MSLLFRLDFRTRPPAHRLSKFLGKAPRKRCPIRAAPVTITSKVQAPARPVLTTQLYFPDEPANRRDGLFRRDLAMRITEAPGRPRSAFRFCARHAVTKDRLPFVAVMFTSPGASGEGSTQLATSAVVQESSSSEQAANATTTGFRDPRSPA